MSPHRVYTYLGQSTCRECGIDVYWFRTPSGGRLAVTRCVETTEAAPDGHWLEGDEITRAQACESILRYPHQCERRV